MYNLSETKNMESTIIKIDKEHKDIIARCAAENALPCYFYTIESNEQMMQCVVHTNNPAVMFHLGKMVGHAVDSSELKKTKI